MYRNDYKEKRNRRVLAIFFVIYLGFFYKCNAQMTSGTAMKFSCGKSDTIYIKIASDSLYNDCRLMVSCTKHKHLDWVSITFGFIDGSILEVFAGDNWVIRDISKLKEVKFDFISFDDIISSTACVNIRTKDYFVKYFNQVQN